MERAQITIIGGGPVGLFAAFYAGLRGMSVRIIDSLPQLGGQLTTLYPEKYIYDMPGFPKILAKDLANHMIHQGIQFNPHIVLDEEALELEKDENGYRIKTHKGNFYPTHYIIIAAGIGAFMPMKLGVDREAEFEGKGLYYGVKTPEDFANQSVIIVGGGDSAFDWACHLEPFAKDIKLVHRRDQFRAHEKTVRLVQNSSVDMQLFKIVKELKGSNFLESVIIEDVNSQQKQEFKLDALIVNVGYKSSLGPLKQWGLNIHKNQIVVDQHFQTNLQGIYAVGDVATYQGKIKLIATGVSEASMAVCHIKTQSDPYAKLFPGHSSDMDLKDIREHIAHENG